MRKKENIVVVGGGRHARVVIDLLQSIGRYKIIGVVDPRLKTADQVLNVGVLGDDDQLGPLFKKKVRFAALGIGSRGDNFQRANIYLKVTDLGFSFPALVHPQAYVSRFAHLDQGVQVMAGACIQPGAFIGENSVINTGTVVEHDCQIGRNVYIGPNSVLSGNVFVKDGTFIGSGACVIPEIVIGAHSLVSAGAVVVKDVGDNQRVMGVPAKNF